MRYIFCDDANKLGAIGGLRSPDRVTALCIEGFSLPEDGFEPESGAFEAHNIDATLVVTDTDTGNYLFGLLTHALRKELTDEFLDNDNEAVIALWHLDNNRVAVLAGDAGGSDSASFALTDSADDEREAGKPIKTFNYTHFTPEKLGMDDTSIAAMLIRP